MRHLIAHFVTALLMTSVPAVSATVTSGEHGSFTRLVFPKGSAEWRVLDGQQIDGIKIKISNTELDFDFSQVYNRIDRSRVLNIESSGGEISITFGCSCEARLFDFQSDFLVIDISEVPISNEEESGERGAPSVNSRDNLQEERLTLDQKELISRLSMVQISKSNKNGTAIQFFPTTFKIFNEKQLIAQDEAGSHESLPAVMFDIESIIKDSMLSGRLVAEGLSVSPNIPAVIDEVAPQSRKAGHDDDSAYRITRVLDGIASGNHEEIPIANCQDGESVEDLFRQKIQDSGSYAELFGELDKFNEESLDAQFSQLIQVGKGAEARRLLSLAGQHNPLKVSISYGVDGEIDPNEYFYNKAECDNSAALWAVVTTNMTNGAEINGDAISIAFERLPDEMKNHIGRVLVQRLIRLNRRDEAGDIIRRLARSGLGHPKTIEMLKVELSSIFEAHPELLQKAITLSSESSSIAASMVPLAIEIADRLNERVPETFVQLNDALLSEYEGLEEYERIWLAQVASLSDNAKYPEAINLLSDSETVRGKARSIAEIRLATSIIQSSSDFEFINLALNEFLPESVYMIPNLTKIYLTRLIDAGLYKEAIKLKENLKFEEIDTEMKKLFATAYIKLGKIEAAEDIVSEIVERDAQVMLGNIKMKQGSYSEAEAVFANANERRLGLLAAWMAGDVSGYSGVDDVRVATLESNSLEEQNVFSDIGEISTLIDDSSVLRQNVGRLMSDLQVIE